MAQVYIPSTWEAETGQSQLQGQPRLNKKTCLPKNLSDINDYLGDD